MSIATPDDVGFGRKKRARRSSERAGAFFLSVTSYRRRVSSKVLMFVVFVLSLSFSWSSARCLGVNCKTDKKRNAKAKANQRFKRHCHLLA